jgi:hypothetical protein
MWIVVCTACVQKISVNLESIRIFLAISCVIIIHYDNFHLSLNHSLNQSMNPCSLPLSYICPNLLSVPMNPYFPILSKTLLAQLSIMMTHLSLYYQEVLINLSNYTSANWLLWIFLLKLCKLLEGWFFGLSQLSHRLPLSNIHIT